MQGHWFGDGYRHSFVSGSDRPIQVEVNSEIQGDLLISRNTVTEEGQTYERIYWLRAKKGESDVFELGYGDGASPEVSAVGIYSENSFEVEQPLTPELVLKSKTVFESDQSLYSEKGYRGDSLLFETKITFVRKPLGKSRDR